MHIPDSLSILKNESKIDTLLNHNQKKYQYRGEPGEEYRVIAGMFNELNQAVQLENKHIRWYAVINYLIFRYNAQRIKREVTEISLLMSEVVFRKISKSTDHPDSFMAPPYIDVLESYVIGISRFGIFLSSNREKNKWFSKCYLEEITRQLNRLLQALDNGSKQPADDYIFRLTIKESTENVILHSKNPPEILFNNLIQVTESDLFKRFITGIVNSLNPETIGRIYRTDDFWNGIIP